MGAVLEADGLSVAAGRMAVLRDVSFSVAPGQVLGVVGESGAGKSMIGRTIAQALPPGFAVHAGSLRFGGAELVGMEPGRRRALLGREIAFIPQEPMAALNPVLTIGQQMGEHLWRLGLRSRVQRRARAVELLEQVHLRDPAALLGRYPHQLSGGMCQRVLIAMAFAAKPRLVVADEPTTALDVTIQARVVQILAELQAQSGTAVIFITHDLRLAAQICDDILVLYAGRPAERGAARGLFAAPRHPYTRCLQLAIPPMVGPRRPLFALRDQMPGLLALGQLQGCRFAPRCPEASEDCHRVEPAFGPGQTTACLHPERTGQIALRGAPPAAAGDAGEEVLRVEQLGRVFSAGSRFWGRRQTVALRHASFSIAAGEFVALVGESGSGKSTVARLVMGLDQPSQGRILLGGQDAAGDRARRLAFVQMVFQDPQSALNPRHRVGDIITQAMRVGAAAPDRARQARAAELLAQVGLAPEIAGRYPSQLSGGQRQRVNIARALCRVPRLLVADEIASGLDVSVQAQVLDMLLRLRAELGFAMLFISHDLSVVRYLCSRVLVMHQGEIVEQGATEAVFGDPQHPYTRRLLAAVPPDDAGVAWVPGGALVGGG
jgi:peptide/nickel transport system ATP-binding protein